MTATPQPITVTRYRCPHCGTSRSKETATAAHMARCWRNPAVKSCKTCAHFIPGDWLTTRGIGPDDDPETCGQGLLDGAAGIATGCGTWAPTPSY